MSHGRRRHRHCVSKLVVGQVLSRLIRSAASENLLTTPCSRAGRSSSSLASVCFLLRSSSSSYDSVPGGKQGAPWLRKSEPQRATPSWKARQRRRYFSIGT